ncbi:zinc finger, CCHC-type containing protein [Tanacetum coccineum]
MWHCLRSLKFKYEPLNLLKFVGDFSVIDGHLGNDDLLETNEISYSARIRAMAKEDAFLVDDVEGGLCIDNADAGIDGRFNKGSNKDKGKVLKLLSNNEKSGSRPKPNSNNSLMAQEGLLWRVLREAACCLSLMVYVQNVTNMGVVRLLRDSIALENQTSLGRIHANSNTFSRLGLPSPQMTMTLPQVHSEEQESSTTVFPGVDVIAWWIDSGSTTHVPDDSDSVYMSSSAVVNYSLWHARLGHLYLVEGSRDQVGSQYSYCYSIEEDSRTYNEAIQSRDFAFWKEVIDDEIGSIIENNTWVLSDLPPGLQTFRLLLALAAIHNLVIHQMDVKTAFLNGDLKEEVYMKQPEGFVMPGNEHKDMEEADVILGIKIKRKNKGILITQSHYIEKILKKFNCEDYSLVSTPMDSIEKLIQNTGKPVDQLEYSRAIGYLMYAMTSTRPNIAYAVDRLRRSSYVCALWWMEMARTLALVDVDGKISMLDLVDHLGYLSVCKMVEKCVWSGKKWIGKTLLFIGKS